MVLLVQVASSRQSPLASSAKVVGEAQAPALHHSTPHVLALQLPSEPVLLALECVVKPTLERISQVTHIQMVLQPDEYVSCKVTTIQKACMVLLAQVMAMAEETDDPPPGVSFS